MEEAEKGEGVQHAPQREPERAEAEAGGKGPKDLEAPVVQLSF